jgi:hypothetical protein
LQTEVADAGRKAVVAAAPDSFRQEVLRPLPIKLQWDFHRRPRSDAAFAAAKNTPRQLVFTVGPAEVFPVYLLAHTVEQEL